MQDGVVSIESKSHSSQPAKKWTVCSHLSPLLDGLIRYGATIQGVDEGWTAVDFVVHLDKGPSSSEFARIAALPEGVAN
jgi:hypothetical protein